MKLLYILTLLATLVGASAAQPLGAIRMNSDTTGTNTRSSAVIITNLSGSGNTGVMLRDSQHTNSVKVLSLTGDRVAIVHTDKTITNSFITVTWLNSLSNVVGNIQEQINNIVSSGTNNWINEGTTNSTLAGIGKPWALEVTNSVQVGALGEAGLIEMVSTNGTYSANLQVDSTGALNILSLGDVAGTAVIINSSNTVTFPGLMLDIQNAGVSKFQVTEEGGVLADDDIRVEDPGDASRFALLEHDALRVTDKLSLYPRQADGFTPYLMDTFLTHTSGSILQVLNMGTLEFNVAANSGYTGAGTEFLADDGTYKSITSGAGITNININPTDGYLPYRSNATVFGDSSFFRDPAVSTNVAFDSQLLAYGLGAGTANYERLMIDHQNTSGAVFDSQAGGSGTARDFVFKASGTTRATLSTTGSLTIPRSTTNDWIWLQTGFFVNGHGDLQLDVPGGEAGEVLIQPVETTLPFVFDTRHPIPGAHTAFQNNDTNIVEWNGDGNGIFKGTLRAMTSVNVLSRAYGAACSDLTTPIVVGASQGIIRLPHKMTVTEVRASVLTAQTSGATLTFDVLENGVSILSNPITIENTETTSKDSGSQPVISDSTLADDSVITLDTTQVGDGTAIGLQFWVVGVIAP
jgi:hypothetical protein